MDTLTISALRIPTYIGVHAWEQQILQTLLIDVTIPMDFTLCKDKLENTLNYDTLCQQLMAVVSAKTFTLIETVAEELACFIKQTFNVPEVTVSVSKPHAVKQAGNVRVTLTR